MNDSDGGGRCCSTRKRFALQRYFDFGPARSMSLCDMTALLYVVLYTIRLNTQLPKGEIAV